MADAFNYAVNLIRMVKASAVYAEGCGFGSSTVIFPDFFCRGICRAGVNLCCLSLIVTLWVGMPFLLSYI